MLPPFGWLGEPAPPCSVFHHPGGGKITMTVSPLGSGSSGLSFTPLAGVHKGVQKLVPALPAAKPQAPARGVGGKGGQSPPIDVEEPKSNPRNQKFSPHRLAMRACGDSLYSQSSGRFIERRRIFNGTTRANHGVAASPHGVRFAHPVRAEILLPGVWSSLFYVNRGASPPFPPHTLAGRNAPPNGSAGAVSCTPFMRPRKGVKP
jgi:hypothetical protein